jgi:biotin synthase
VFVGNYFPVEDDLVASGAQQNRLHELAAEATRRQFGDRVFVRAVVEVSNFCRENCSYCGMRKDNRSLARFRARHDQLAELLLQHRPECVTDINIQAGEDPVAVREVVLPLLETLRRHNNSLGISVCLGTLNPSLYTDLQAAGASIYIMKFEGADPHQYERLEAPGTLAERIEHIKSLAAAGWKVSSGFIAGLPGQTSKDLLANLALANSLPLDGCSVSPFVPGNETPLGNCASSEPNWTFNSIAAMRLMRPNWIIPAVSAMNIVETDGYRHALRAGANLVTINLTPSELRGDYVIYKRNRIIMTEERVLNALSAEGLVPSDVGLANFYRSTKPATSGREVLT